jgi:hypothetical protein
MVEALLNGKLSREQENMEDIITSIFFGLLKYVPLNEGLLQFLHYAINTENCKLPTEIFNCENVLYKFWPFLEYYSKNCEPDVLIELSQKNSKYIILIEAKYNSGKSSLRDSHGYVNDQLAREYMNLLLLAKKENAKPILIYLTKDLYIPQTEITNSIKEINEKENITNPEIYWLSWRHITQIKTSNQILNDIIVLVRDRLHLFFFNGFNVKKISKIDNWNFLQI